jgi:hypothetical protein
VDAQDLNLLALNWQTETSSWCAGDFGADGMVNSADLNSLGINWQIDVASSPVTAAAALPVEPASERHQPDEVEVAEQDTAVEETAKPAHVPFAVQRRFLSRLSRRRLANPDQHVARSWADQIDDVMGNWKSTTHHRSTTSGE